jgi:hypothetical protein
MAAGFILVTAGEDFLPTAAMSDRGVVDAVKLNMDFSGRQ